MTTDGGPWGDPRCGGPWPLATALPGGTDSGDRILRPSGGE